MCLSIQRAHLLSLSKDRFDGQFALNEPMIQSKNKGPSDRSTSTRLSASKTFIFHMSNIPKTLAPSPRCLPADKETLETRLV